MHVNLAEHLKNDANINTAKDIIESCINCGCCLQSCPTYDLTGDELEGPRGRINILKDMLETGQAPDAKAVEHIDSCLSCLSCTSACPSNVDYMHLIDFGRAHIAKNYTRGRVDAALRNMLTKNMAEPDRFSRMMALGRIGRRFHWALVGGGFIAKLRAAIDLVPSASPAPATDAAPAPAQPARTVALLKGCVQSVLDSEINAAAQRLLARANIAVIEVRGQGCCGAIELHGGEHTAALGRARANIDAFFPMLKSDAIDAIIPTATGCGTTMKDYGELLAGDANYAIKAKAFSEYVADLTEVLVSSDLPKLKLNKEMRVAYHPPCSLQHGQKVLNEPRKVLLKAGFRVARAENETHCCGSAGTYNIQQPENAQHLGTRKASHLEATGADVIVTGNIGCIVQIRKYSEVPVVHIAKFLDWIYGGPKPGEFQS